MILIADSGSTKVDWRAISNDGTVLELTTEGINPVFQTKEIILSIINDKLVPAFGKDITDIFFYGAGVVSAEMGELLGTYFSEVYPGCKTVADSDILAAAKALCGDNPGIVCIMGTGSNSAFYDGEKIVRNVKAGGFILGDEASGGYLGKRLISDFIKELLPEDLKAEFDKRYNLTYLDIVKEVYKSPVPSRFLASFSPFLSEFREHPYVKALLEDSFDQYLTRNIKHYDYKNNKVNLIGSIAFYYQDILKERAALQGMEIGRIIKSPIIGLVEYYKEKFNK